MLFINAALFAGLGALLVPVAIHLWSKRKRRFTEWAAMQFLVSSLTIRQRKIELEDVLLLVIRCLVLALLILAVTRPFVPAPISSVPWAVVIPLGFVAVAALAATAALWHDPAKRAAGIVLAVLAAFASWKLFHTEREFQDDRLGGDDPRDIVIIIDASASMAIAREGTSNFERALSDARALVEDADAETAFAVIQAGMRAKERSQGLTTDRQAIENALNASVLTESSMDALGALSAALEILETGRHPHKKIVFLTDRQKLGWDTTDAARWNVLAAQAEKFLAPPALLLWEQPFPDDYRNIGMTSVQTSHPRVNVHSPARIVVTYENTGSAAITPSGVECVVDGVTYESQEVNQVAPGASGQTVFEHHFKTPNTHPIEARLLVDDALDSDNEGAFVAQVAGEMRILVVDAEASLGSYFDAGSAYVRLALGTRSEDEEESMSFESDYLPVSRLTEQTLRADDVNAVWLAAPQQLPPATRSLLSRYIESGGGLIVSFGRQVDKAGYNVWQGENRRPVLPAVLEEPVERSRLGDGVHIEPQSLRDGPLHVLSDSGTSDIQTALFSHYWQVTPRGAVRARLNNGAPLLLNHQFGLGQVWMFATSLDAEASSLVTRDCFLPMVAELATATAGANAGESGVSLNLQGEPRLTLTLDPPPSPAVKSWPAEIVTPGLKSVETAVEQGPGGTVTSFDWDGTPGLHELVVPGGDTVPELARLVDDSGHIPFTVSRDVAESRQDLLDSGDLAALRSVFDVLEVATLENTRQILTGIGHGKELWRLFCLGTLGFLVLEMFIARWVSRRRRIGDPLCASVSA